MPGMLLGYIIYLQSMGMVDTMAEQEILLCDLDAFFAAVEQRDSPDLMEKPLIVGGTQGSRGVVSTCSYEARKYGVRSAMPIKQAEKLCPQAIFLPVNMGKYQEVSAQVKEILNRYTPDIETVSIDEAYLAVKGGSGYRTGEAIRFSVKEELHLPISIGVSVNKLLAKIACEMAKPDGMEALWPEKVPNILWPCPVKVLPGVGPATEEKLKKHGFTTVKDVADSTEESLKRILGTYGSALKELALGRDSRKLQKGEEIKSVSEETTFNDDIYHREYILAILQEQASGVGYRLRSHKLYARTISLKLRFSNFRTITRDLTLSSATNNDKEIFTAVSELFQRHSGSPPWRLVGTRLSGLQRSRQLSMFPQYLQEEKEEQLNYIKDNLRDKYGNDVVYSGLRLYKRRE